MSENSENKEMKTSGLRLPTKIPTMGVSRLPSSSSIKLDGINSVVTKIDRGSTVKKNADMPHSHKHNDGFNKKPTDERKSSSGSESFMGDARRLSEAGVRRSSGNSVVLTEDTDKFIIGNRIWVGGTKPGQIAYIGETNFGNGDWAGIVLDEPIGKNDGSVSGTRYFQCEPKKGIFARLTNLTSAPLSSIEDSMIQSSFSKAKPLGFSTPMPKREASTVTAIKPAVKSIIQPTLSKSTSDLKIGDRVIISSGQGSKLGILKYRGATQFAPGEWCGIELDDPLGKNDGTVEGIRYFECEDKFGLFTPIAKVSKSPMSSSRMSTNCAIHKAKRSPGSLNGSMISNITTNTMSSIPSRQVKVTDLDRLKLQLTQMKKENELLRSQVTKAANQADAAEKKLEETLKAEVDKPSETQTSNMIILKNQLDSMKKQMDEEKEKVQNLQFTNEEQNVVNIELQNKNSELLIKIKELEVDLGKERNLTKDVEKETMKIFEKEEELCRIKEELESLKKVIDNNEDELQKSVSNLSSEVVDKESHLNTLRQTLNENSQTHDRLLKEANEKLFATTERLNKVIEEKDKKIEQNQEMIDQLNEGIKCLSALKNEEHDDTVNSLKNELSKLKDEYKVIIDKYEKDNKISLENYIKKENDFKQELANLLENKNREIELHNKKYTDIMYLNNLEKESIITKNSNLLEKLGLLENSKLNLEEKLVANEVCIQDIQNSNQSIKEKDIIISDNQIKIKELEHLILQTKNEYHVILKQKEEEIKELLKIGEEKMEVEKLSLEEKTKIILDEKDKEHSKLNKKIEDLENIKKTLENQLEASESREQNMNNLNELIQEKIKMIEDKNLEIEHLNNLILLTKNECETKLQEKDHVNELLKISEEKINSEKKQYEVILAEKDKDISHFIEKLHSMESNELNLEKQLKISETQNHEIIELKKSVEDKTKAIDDNNLKMEFLNKTIAETKKDSEIKVKEKENQMIELEKISEDKLTNEKIAFETRIQTCLNEKNTEIEILKNRLQEFVENNTEKELMLKLESASDELEKEKIRVTNLEVLKKELEKTVSEHKAALELLEISKSNMIKTIEEQKTLNAELKDKSKIESEKLEMLGIKKQINELKNECSVLQSTLDEKNNEIENIKKNVLVELKKSVEDKTKIIDDKNIKIDQLSNTIMSSKEEFSTKLREKENDIEERIKITEDKFMKERLLLDNNTKILLEDKDKEILHFEEKLHSLESIKLNLEKQLKISETQNHEIIELKKSVEDKTKAIDDNNLKIEFLNKTITETKNDLEIKVKEKENQMKELEKIGEDKLTNEKIAFETRIQTCLNDKNTEIELLKNRLQEFVENNTEKELLLKLESASDELEKEKIRVTNLEVLKKELEKTVSEHKAALELLEISKSNMIKTIEEQKTLNAELKDRSKIESEQLDGEMLGIKKQINELKNECSVLQSTLDEKNNEIENIKKNVLVELKKSVEDKTKIIDGKNIKIDQLSNTIMSSEEEFSTKLREKENDIEERIKITEDKFMKERLLLENNTKILLEEKNKEILHFEEKLHSLESIKLNLEKQLKISETQNHEIIELKKSVEDKTKAIDDNNLKIEFLNKTIAETKKDLEIKVKEKENQMKELEKIGEDKLTNEKIAFETRIQTCLNDKNTEIELLKNRLQEFVENNTEKELMLKLESASDELEKEKVRVTNLEVLKKELEKTVSEHKAALELLEISKSNMIKTIEEQNTLNAELKDKSKIESEQLDGEMLEIQKQINELKNECSVLQSSLDKKNFEIEQLKSQKLESGDSDSNELSRLKSLLEKDRNTQSHLEFRIQELTEENHCLNERIENDSNQLQKNHNDNQEKYNIEKKYEETYSMLKIKENQVLVLQTELNSWKLKDMEKCKNNNSQEKSDKSDAHLLAEKNEEIKMLNSIVLGLHKKLSAVMETDVSEFEVEKNPNGISKEDYQKLYKTIKNNVKLKECENLSLKQEIYKLKTENERYSEFKTKCESLENDKNVLQRLVVNYESSHPANVKNEKTDAKSETEKILEEKDWQINLLNNIIAGLHSKVSENKFKMEALEKQILDSGLDQNKKVRLRTTRLYCERCEIFDSHDTEDCPEKPESPKVQRKRRVVNDGSNKNAEEPFCVCCDMFGHTANECDSSLTF